MNVQKRVGVILVLGMIPGSSAVAAGAEAAAVERDVAFEVTTDSAGRPDGVALLANDLWRAFGSPDEGKRREALHTFGEGGTAVISAALMVMDRDDGTRGKMARETLMAAAHHAAGGPLRSDVSEALARALGREHMKDTREAICRALSFVGGDEAVPALADGLNDPEVREMARWALARIPTDKAVTTLVVRLTTADPESRIALINAIAQNPHTPQVPAARRALTELLARDDGAVRAAAMDTLALFPEQCALDALKREMQEDRAGAVEAMLALAETFAEASDNERAVSALVSVAERGDLTPVQRRRLLHGFGRVRSDFGRDFVLAALDDEDRRVVGTAVQTCSMMPGEKATQAIAEKMAAAEGAIKSDLLWALGHRGPAMTTAAARLIGNAVLDDDEAVQVAAIQAVEHAGLAPAVPAVLQVLTDSSERVQDAAERAVHHAPGDAVTGRIMDAVAGSPPEVKAKLLRALGRRGAVSAFPLITQATRDPGTGVRVAALEAIGLLGAGEGLGALLRALQSGTPDEHEAAKAALMRMRTEDIAFLMLRAYPTVDEPVQAVLLDVLGRRENPVVADLLKREVQHDEPAIRAAALAHLWRQDPETAGPTLLAEAKRGPAEVTRSAIDSYLRLAGRREAQDSATAGPMYVTALQHAVTDEQKREALQGMQRTVSDDRVDLLPVVVPFMRSGAAREEAAELVSRLAGKLPESRRDEAVDLLREVVDLRPSDRAVRRAVEHLRERGVDIDPAREAGFVTQWWLIGPYPNPDGAMFDKAYEPERTVDLDATEEVEGATLRWQSHRTEDLNGIVNLEPAVARRNEVGAYAYAEIVVDEPQDVVLRMGSDDGIIVWVNGEQVHANNVIRGLQVDEDRAAARLQKGTNRIFVKVLQGMHDWAFCLRITTPEGEPVEFTPAMQTRTPSN